MKRLSDLVIASLAFVVLLPVMTATALGVLIAHGRPILFMQQRPGLDGSPFSIYKFRTMLNGESGEVGVNSDAIRLTRFGSFLRSTSLDELPELWNVIRGDMSLVGPRPLLMAYLDLYSAFQARRHEVRPGITGWAQVNGRNALTWEEKFELDVWYVDNRSLWLDVKILLMTVVKVLKRDDISHEGSTTMERFRGNSQ